MPTGQGTRPARRTRERILDATLALYNELGEPNVSTTLIASETGISAGNLHYHFRKKDQLTGALLDRFVDELDQVLPPEQWRPGDVEDAWFLGPLFLFNNLHALHHEQPGLPWYRYGARYRTERARLLPGNGGLVYRGYLDVARRYLLRPHDQLPHPRGRAPLAQAG